MNNKDFLKLYIVDDAYIRDLQENVDEHVFASINPKYVEYSGAVKPPVRKDGNRLSGQVETANASLLA